MHTESVYPGRFVSADELKTEAHVVIARTVLEDVINPMTHEKASRPACYFEKATKPMLIGRRNWRIIAKAYGHESDAWTGKRIVLTVRDYSIGGEVVQGIVVTIPKQGRGPSPAAKAAIEALTKVEKESAGVHGAGLPEIPPHGGV